MKVRVTFDLSDDMRRALSARTGKSGKATRSECESVIWGLALADLSQILSEYEQERRDRVSHQALETAEAY